MLSSKTNYMKKLYRLSVVLFLGILFLASCKKNDSGPDTDTLINPADPNALTGVVVMPDGTSQVTGSVPSPTGTVETPVITSLLNGVITSNGSTAPFLYTYSNVINDLAGFY